MTPQEIQQLQSFGIQKSFLPVEQVVAALCYGLSLPVFGYAAVIINKKHPKGRSTYILTLVGSLGFILSTLTFAGFSLGSSITFNSPIWMTTPSGGFSSKNAVSERQYHLWIAQAVGAWASTWSLNASDAAVVWRASVLFHPRPVGIWVLYLLLIATIALSLVLPWRAYTNYQWTRTIDLKLSTTLDRMNDLSGYFSVGTNVISTVLIGYKLFEYTTFLRRNGLKHLMRGSVVKKILVVLIETGMLFSIVQALVVTLEKLAEDQLRSSTVDISLFEASDVVGIAFLMFSAVYPLVITTLVYTQESVFASDLHHTSSVLDASVTK